MRIHLFDLVTSSEESMENRIFTVVEARKIGELSEVEGLWGIEDFHTKEIIECPGCFLTVWKPFSIPDKVMNKEEFIASLKNKIDILQPMVILEMAWSFGVKFAIDSMAKARMEEKK